MHLRAGFLIGVLLFQPARLLYLSWRVSWCLHDPQSILKDADLLTVILCVIDAYRKKLIEPNCAPVNFGIALAKICVINFRFNVFVCVIINSWLNGLSEVASFK